MTIDTQAQRAAALILSGRLTVLQRRALADLVIALASRSEPFTEDFKIIYGSALDALAPTRPDGLLSGPPLRFSGPGEPVSGPAQALVTLTARADLSPRQRAMIAALLTVLSALDLQSVSPALDVAFTECVDAFKESAPT
jgi:hypothetical protein